MIWRAGPAGGAAGGTGVSEIAFAASGRHDRPWSPAHVRAQARSDGGFDLGWVTRSRVDGDRWDGEAASADSMRFRVRVLAGAEVVRTLEVDRQAVLYPAGDAEADFSGGPGPDAILAVAQWGEGYGWGVEARVRLG